MFLWAFLIGLTSANPTCSVQPTWTWNVHFECQGSNSKQVAKILPSDSEEEKLMKVKNLRAACNGGIINVFLSRSAVQNHQTSSRKKRAARIVNGINCTPYDVAYAGGYLSAFAFHPVYRAEIQTCLGEGIDFLSSGEWEEDLDFGDCPDCYLTDDNEDSFQHGDLHVMLLVDMDVVNEVFWTSLLPWSVKKHLEEVFPDSSRKRRAARIVNGINCTPYDLAHARGYLAWLLKAAPNLASQIQTCLGSGIELLSSGQWGQDDCALYDAANEDGNLDMFWSLPAHQTKLASCGYAQSSSNDWGQVGRTITYELVLTGPNNIYMHYPFVKPEDENTSGSRKRRAARIVNGINCAPYDQAYARDYLWVLLQYPNLHSAIETCLGPEVLGNGFLSSGQWGQDDCAVYDEANKEGNLDIFWSLPDHREKLFNCGYDSHKHQDTVCHIESRVGLISRLFLSVSRVPSIPQSLYSQTGLQKAPGLRNLMGTLARFSPETGNLLVMNVANDLDVNQKDINEFQAFVKHSLAGLPGLKVAFNWHYGPNAFNTPGDLAPEIERCSNFNAQGPQSVTGLDLVTSFEFGTNMEWAVSNSDWKYKGYFKTPVGTYANVGTLTDTQTTKCAVHWLAFGHKNHAVCGFDFGGITDTPPSIPPPGGAGCAARPCLNGCTCQASCRDENDYVCVPPPGASLIGKNCEYEATVMCHADRSISISVPKQAINDYAMGVSNVVLQGCNPPRGSQGNQFLCDTNSPSCGPPVAPRPNSPSVSLTCPASSNLMVGSGTQFTFRQTFVFERASAVISMPRPLVTVECKMATVPASAVITPQIRDPNSKRMVLTWVPRITFFKTQFGNPNVKLVGDGNAFPDGSFGYIIGERIHVRINAALNGRLGSSLPNNHNIKLDSCVIQRGNNQENLISIIQSGSVVPGLPFPVEIDQGSGNMGASVPLSQEGVAFNFQVFTFGPGQTLLLTCSVDIDAARRRRSARNETVTVEKVHAKILFFEPEDTVESDVSRMSLIQEPVRAYELKSLKSDNENEAVEIEEILEKTKWLGLSPWLVLALVAGAALLVLAMALSVVRQRFQSVVEYEPGMKPLVEKY